MFDLKKSIFDDLSEDWNNLFKAVGVESLEELSKGEKKEKKPEPAKKKKQEKPEKKPEKKPVAKKKASPKPKSKKKGEPKTVIIAPHDDEKLNELHEHLDGWNDTEASVAFKEASQDHYLIALMNGDTVSGVGSFKRSGKTLQMEHFASNKEVKGGGKCIVQKLLEQASKMDFGVVVKPPKGAGKCLKKMGFTDSELNGTLSLDSEEVKKVVSGQRDGDTDKVTDSKEPKEKPKTVSKDESKANEHKKATKAIKKVRKQLGSAHHHALLEHHGVSWEKSKHDGVNHMRASMAAADHIKGGGKLDVKSYVKHIGSADKEKKQDREKSDEKIREDN